MFLGCEFGYGSYVVTRLRYTKLSGLDAFKTVVPLDVALLMAPNPWKTHAAVGSAMNRHSLTRKPQRQWTFDCIGCITISSLIWLMVL